jgi:hypothetical protein
MGVSEYPLLQNWQIKGLAVGLVRRYPMLPHPTEGYVRRYASHRVLVERQSIGSIKN